MGFYIDKQLQAFGTVHFSYLLVLFTDYSTIYPLFGLFYLCYHFGGDIIDKSLGA